MHILKHTVILSADVMLKEKEEINELDFMAVKTLQVKKKKQMLEKMNKVQGT